MGFVAFPFLKRIRKAFESIAYVGLQPGAQTAKSTRLKWLGPLRGPLERFLAGGAAPSDPLYLTNRSLGQKARIGAAIGVPCLVLGYLMYAVLAGDIDFGPKAPPHEPTASEVAAKLLPHMDENIRIETNHDVDVVEVRIEHGTPPSLTGIMKNNTDHEIRVAEAVFDLTDVGGSQLGGVSAKVQNLKAGSSATFRFPIQQNEAAFALVREVHSQ